MPPWSAGLPLLFKTAGGQPTQFPAVLKSDGKPPHRKTHHFAFSKAAFSAAMLSAALWRQRRRRRPFGDATLLRQQFLGASASRAACSAAVRAAAASACRCRRAISSVGEFAASRPRSSHRQSSPTGPRPTSRRQRSVGRVHSGHFHDQVAHSLELADLVASESPEFDGAVAASGNEPPVVQELQARCTARVSSDALDSLAVLHRPQGNRAVFAGRGQDVRVVAQLIAVTAALCPSNA